MAARKEALAPMTPALDLCTTAAACRASLSATVAELSETIAALPPTTIKRRLKDAVIVMPFSGSARAAVAGEIEIEDPSCPKKL